MPGPFNNSTDLSLIAGRLRRWSSLYSANILLCLGAIVAGVLLAVTAPSIERGERLIVGNAGGTLAVVFELADSRILVGAGASRSHSADLIGRTTRPWDREIDLLIIPGWDDHHAAGALGLLERESVSSVAVAGLPGDSPIWTLLERESQESNVPIRYLDGSHFLELNDSTTLTLAALARSADGAWLRLDHHGTRIDVVDAPDVTSARPDPRTLPPRNDHLLINTRGQQLPSGAEPKLSLMPAPFWQSDFPGDGSPYWAGIRRNEHIVLDLAEDGIRVDLDEVDVRDD
ncbi:MAG: hypothetical protein WD401_00975 [Thermomicrobiaceae bacterium]